MKTKSRKKKARVSTIFLIIVSLIIAVAIVGIVILIQKYAPTKERMPLSEYYKLKTDDASALIINDELSETEDGAVNAIVQSGSPYVSLDVINESFSEHYYYDSTEGVLRYVTATDVVSASKDSPDYTVGISSVSNKVPVLISENDTNYISLDFVKNFTDITYTLSKDPYRLTISSAGLKRQVSTVKRDTEIRRLGGPKSKILSDVKKGDKVIYLRNYGKWTRVISSDGVLGYIRNSCIDSAKDETVKATLTAQECTHILLDEKVKLLWHQVTTADANTTVTSVISRSPGVNVLSPTWFSVAGNDGSLSSIASLDYVNTCHAANIKVWGLFGNVEAISNGVDMTGLLSTTSSRDNLVNNIVAQAVAYSLDGVNIDFEQLKSAAGPGYGEFIRELALKCHKNDIVLSIDNYVPSDYTAFYDRANQAKFADYVVIMAYDEYTTTSTEAGSTASISFVKQGVEDTLKEVPKEQIILGMPFYTRLWTEENGALSCTAMRMNEISDFLAQHNATATWDDSLGQNYAEVSEDTKTYKIWVEDSYSIEEKLKVLDSNSLAGGAFWKSGQELPEVWDIINKYIN